MSRLQIGQRKLAKKLKTFAIVTSILLIVVAGGVFGYETVLRLNKKKLVDEKKQLNQSISQFQTELELQQRLRFRLKIVSELLDSRIDNSERLDDLVALLPTDVVVEKIGTDRNYIEFKGQIGSLTQLKELEDNVASARKQETYQQIELSSLNRTISGWPFSLKIKL